MNPFFKWTAEQSNSRKGKAQTTSFCFCKSIKRKYLIKMSKVLRRRIESVEGMEIQKHLLNDFFFAEVRVYCKLFEELF